MWDARGDTSHVHSRPVPRTAWSRRREVRASPPPTPAEGCVWGSCAHLRPPPTPSLRCYSRAREGSFLMTAGPQDEEARGGPEELVTSCLPPGLLCG